MKRWKGQTSKIVAVLLAAALTASPTTSYAAVLTNEEPLAMDEVETPEEQVTMDEPVEDRKKYRTNAGIGSNTRRSSCLFKTKLY